LLEERINSKGSWGHAEDSIQETQKLLTESEDKESSLILKDTLEYLLKMESLIK